MSIVNFNDYAPYYVDGERRAEEEMANQQQWMLHGQTYMGAHRNEGADDMRRFG